MRRIKLEISYAGRNYSGWQVQKNAHSVSGVIMDALCDLLGERVSLIGSGRTDAGVSAKCQVAHFDTNNDSVKACDIAKALNVRLPSDISIISSEEVDKSFHAQFNAKRKTYHYHFYFSDMPNAYLDQFATRYYGKFDKSKFDLVCKEYVGTHDFKAFSSTGSVVSSTIRTVYDCSVKKTGDIYTFVITGEGFLYNMVRIMVGTMIEIAQGKRDISCIHDAYDNADRTLLGKTAPACGLVLYDVKY